MKQEGAGALRWMSLFVWVGSTLMAVNGLAVDGVWNTNASSGAWEDGANWVGGSAPGSTAGSTSPDAAVYRTSSTTLTVVPDANRNLATLVFSNAQCGAYTIGTNTGNALLLSSGGMVLLAAGMTNAQAINAPLVLAGDGGAYAFSNASGKTLTCGGGITGMATGANVTTLTLTGTNTGANTISSIIGDGAGGGKVALRKESTGRWDLTGSNTFSGGMTLNAGTLRLGHASCLGSGPVTINGGTVHTSGGVSLNTGNAHYWNGNFAYNTPISSGLNLGTGNVTLGTNVSITFVANGYGSLLTIGGSIGESGGPRSLTFAQGGSNPSTPYLTGSNTFSGGLTLSSGSIRLGHSQALGTGLFTINGGGIMQNYAGAMAGASGMVWNGNISYSIHSSGGTAVDFGAIPVTLTGARTNTIDNVGVVLRGTISGAGGSLAVNGGANTGSLTLSGTNTFDGGVSLKAGTATFTLAINSPSALGTGPFRIVPGGGGATRFDNSSASAIVLAPGNSQLWSNSFTYVGTRSLDMGSGDVTLGTNVTVTVSASTLTVGGAIGAGGQGWSVTKAGTGILALAGASTYTGLTTVAAGKLSLAAGGSLAGNARVMTNATLELQTGGGLADHATLQVDSNGSVYGVVNVSNGVVEIVRVLTLGTNTYTGSGTYGSTNSPATFKFPGYFSGAGMIQVVAATEPVIVNNTATGMTTSAAWLNGTLTATGASATAVSVFWGTNDAGKVVGAWAFTNSFGTNTAALPVSYSFLATNLMIGTQYYYRYYAVNANGATWSEPAESFTTVYGPEPVVKNTGGVTGLGNTTARINGAVIAGTPTPAAFICYGTNNPGTGSTNGWQMVVPKGVQSGAFYEDLTGLTPNQTCYYTCFATNDAGVAWAAPVVTFSTVPYVPLGVSMVANSADSITLAWYNSSNDVPMSYNLFACSTTNGAYTRVATVSERRATHAGLAPGVTNYYKVSAVNAANESPPSAYVTGFTIVPCAASSFPVRVARNMCVSLGSIIVGSRAPTAGKLSNLVDGSDATSCTITGACEVKIKLNTAVSIADAAYLMINFRTDTEGIGSDAYNVPWRALKTYVITESQDSTTGSDGTWTELARGTNTYMDGVVVVPNHSPKWIGIQNNGDLQLCRLEVFRAAPAGMRNDYWIFTGDSLVVQDFAGGGATVHDSWFSDLVRQRYPDRYPMVVKVALGGTRVADIYGIMKNALPVLSPSNGTSTATGTIVCWEPGFNDVGTGGGLWMGPSVVSNLCAARDLCSSNGVIMVPVRLEYSTLYLDKTTLEPATYNSFCNTLAWNLAGVDVFCRAYTPYACDPATQLPYADYWTYTRNDYDTALSADGVHHTRAGSDGINRLWADLAGRMVYQWRQPFMLMVR